MYGFSSFVCYAASVDLFSVPCCPTCATGLTADLTVTEKQFECSARPLRIECNKLMSQLYLEGPETGAVSTVYTIKSLKSQVF
jgi:hypothetical protein